MKTVEKWEKVIEVLEKDKNPNKVAFYLAGIRFILEALTNIEVVLTEIKEKL